MTNNFEFRKQIIANPPIWADQVIEPWDEDGFRDKEPFVKRHYWTGQGSVNVFNVIGTIHSDYKNKSWLNLLINGKRMDLNLPLLKTNPLYYENAEIKSPTMYFKTLDGVKFYIDDDGNHRTCLARFYFYEKGLTHIHGVTINHYQVDDLFEKTYKELEQEIRSQKLNVWLKAKRTLMSREDTAGWKEDLFRTVIEWADHKGNIKELDFHQAQNQLDLLKKHKKSVWAKARRLLGE